MTMRWVRGTFSYQIPFFPLKFSELGLSKQLNVLFLEQIMWLRTTVKGLCAKEGVLNWFRMKMHKKKWHFSHRLSPERERCPLRERP